MSPKKPHTDPQTNTQSHKHSQTYHSRFTFILRKPSKETHQKWRRSDQTLIKYNLHTREERQNNARTLEGRYKGKRSGRSIRKRRDERKGTEKGIKGESRKDKEI